MLSTLRRKVIPVVYVTSQKALFRTSSKVKAPFPPLVALVKPIASVTAAITGRFLRLLWKRSSGEQRKKWRNRNEEGNRKEGSRKQERSKQEAGKKEAGSRKEEEGKEGREIFGCLLAF